MRALAALLATAALAGCATLGGNPPLRDGDRYVAMGSSFAAGAGIGPLKENTPQRCGRTTNNYATLLAARLGLALDDQSCGGATTAHVLGPWKELAPQVDALTPDTRLVTLTIGGNDLNYVGNLYMSACAPGKPMKVQGHSLPCTGPVLPGEADYARVEQGLRQIAQEVRQRAPRARLVFVQYVTLVPESPCPVADLPAERAAPMRELGRRLAEITARVAAENKALVLPADSLSQGHSPCDVEPWANGLPADRASTQGAPWHPNAAGHAAIAEALAALLGR